MMSAANDDVGRRSGGGSTTERSTAGGNDVESTPERTSSCVTSCLIFGRGYAWEEEKGGVETQSQPVSEKIQPNMAPNVDETDDDFSTT